MFEGVTTGTGVGLLIENTDQRSQDWHNKEPFFIQDAPTLYPISRNGLHNYRGGASSARESRRCALA
ncbi:hypothetical protein ACNKHK_15320 [Shigella flexneri]